MTTSYTTSLRMKELNFPQEGGEYYYFEDINALGFPCGTFSAASVESKRFKEYDVVCRAFTLGELVRMLPSGWVLFAYPKKNYYEMDYSANPTTIKIQTIPEEAAAELCCELKVSGVIKFEKEG